MNKPMFEDLPDFGDHMTLEEFKSVAERGMFTDYDGFGELATSTQCSDVVIKPSDVGSMPIPEWATHVMWFNR